MATRETKSKKKKLLKLFNRYKYLILAGLGLIIVIVVIIVICTNCGKSEGSSVKPSRRNPKDTEPVTVVQERTDGSEVVVVNAGHVPELTAGGYVVHGGNDIEPEWILITNQPDASLNTYENQYWTNEGGFIKYTAPGYDSLVGIDLSHYTGDVDWSQIASQGIQFAIIRLGYRGYGNGQLVEDDLCRAYIEGATAAGLKIGCYFVSQAINNAEAVEEAQFCMSIISGYNVELPIYYDMEVIRDDVARTDGLGKDQFTANAMAFCSTIEAQAEPKYRAGIYANQLWYTDNLDLVQVEQYDIWFAKYRDVPDYPYKFDMWQYTETGSLIGVNAAIDLNVRPVKN